MARSRAALNDLCGCTQMRELAEKGDVMYEWAVCGCSPCERNYIIKEGDQWKPLSNCPFCKKPINPLKFQTFMVSKSGLPELAKGYNQFQVTCPKCGHEFHTHPEFILC